MDDIKLVVKTENIEPTRIILMEDVDLGEPTSFLDHENLGCTQRECQIRKDIVPNYRGMFDSRISAGAKEKLPTRASGKPVAKSFLLGPTTWKVTRINVWKDIANLQIKRFNNYTRSRRHAWMTINFKEEENESVGELSTVCSQIVLKCLYLARIGRPDTCGL